MVKSVTVVGAATVLDSQVLVVVVWNTASTAVITKLLGSTADIVVITSADL